MPPKFLAAELMRATMSCEITPAYTVIHLLDPQPSMYSGSIRGGPKRFVRYPPAIAQVANLSRKRGISGARQYSRHGHSSKYAGDSATHLKDGSLVVLIPDQADILVKTVCFGVSVSVSWHILV